MARELAPVLQSTATPEGAVRAPTPEGPVNNPTPLAELNVAPETGPLGPARREGMLNDNQDVPDVDVFGGIARVLGGVSGLLSDMDSTFNRPESAIERKSNALKGLAQNFSSLRSKREQTGSNVTLAARNTATEFLTQYPEYNTEAKSLLSDILGIDSISKTERSSDEIYIESAYNWLSEGPQGKITAVAAQKLPLEQRPAYILSEYARVQAKEADIELANQRLGSITTEDKTRDALELRAADELARNHSQEVSVLMGVILTDDVDFRSDYITGDLTTDLRQIIESTRNDMSAQYTDARISPEIANKKLDEVLQPMTNMLTAIEKSGEDIKRLVDEKKLGAFLEMAEALEESGVGSMGYLPEFQKALIDRILMNDNVGITEAVRSAVAILTNTEDGNPIKTPSTEDNSTNPNVYADPKLTQHLTTNPEDRKMIVTVAGQDLKATDINIPEQRQDAYRNSAVLLTGISAGNDTLSDNSFDVLFTQNAEKFAQLTKNQDEDGIRLTGHLNATLTNQFARNLTKLNALMDTMPAGFTLNPTKDAILFDFNVEAFNKAEDAATTRVKWLLKEEGLVPNQVNIYNVLNNSNAILKDAAVENRSPLVRGDGSGGLAVMVNNLQEITQKINRLNNFDAFAEAIPSLNKLWQEQRPLMFDKRVDVSTLVSPSGFSTKNLEEARARVSKITFSTMEDALLAADRGELEVGGIFIVDGEQYELGMEE